MDEKKLLKNLESAEKKAEKRLADLKQEKQAIINRKKQEELAEKKCSEFIKWLGNNKIVENSEDADFCTLMNNLNHSFMSHKTNDLFENRADLQNCLRTAIDSVSKKVSLITAKLEAYNNIYDKISEDKK